MIDIESEKGEFSRSHNAALLEPPTNSQNEAPEDNHEPEPPGPEKNSILSNGLATTILVCGVIVPAATILASSITYFEPLWHLLLKHPVETIIEGGLVTYLPVANYLTWSRISSKDSRRPIRLGLMNGTAIGTALLASAISIASLILGYPTLDSAGVAHPILFAAVAAVSLLALGAAVSQAEILRRSKATRGARFRTTLYSLLGALLSLAAVGCSEAQSIVVRYNEQLATSDQVQEKQKALEFLRQLNPEKDLRMEVADPRSAGLAGLFIKFNDSTYRQLYFAITGQPYKHNETADVTMQSAEYVHDHVVGEQIPGLSLTRSQMSGSLSGDTLSSTLDWTFVFKNRTFTQQEARTEIAVPPGAVVSGMTLWINGEPRPAAFGATDKVQAAYNWIVVNHRDPALVTDLGKGRVLLQCYPVPAQGEMKVKLKITAPLKLADPTEASVTLPRLVDSNFGVTGENSLRLKSHQKIEMALTKLRRTKTVTGEELVTANLKDSDLTGSGLSVMVKRPASFGSIASFDPRSKDKSYVVETISEVAAKIPNHLVVVLDGSQSVKNHIDEIATALAKLPNNISSSLILASDENGNQLESLPVSEGLKRIKQAHFTGGHDNLQAMIKASEEAGDTTNGAVLWIHGPQPGFNQEIYIMTPFAAKPTFYELDVDNGGTNINEFLKNHREIGPFVPVAYSPSVGRDLERLIAKWQPNGKDYTVRFTRCKTKPSCPIAEGEQAAELAVLSANDLCNNLIAREDNVAAAELAVKYGLVTPVTGATVLESKSDYQKFGLTENVSKNSQPFAQDDLVGQSEQSGQAPMVQAATNGTIGFQAGDATVVQGINTSSAVRVNNLANLEALLNIIANGFEILGVGLGLFHLVAGLMSLSVAQPFPGCKLLSPRRRAIMGVGLIAIGLALPGCINWLVASARDANMFS